MNEQIKIQGLRVNFQVSGSGLAVIILHGWGSRAELWTRVENQLVAQGFKVVVPDLIGFGSSDVPPRGWQIDDYLEWLYSFIDKLSERHPEFKDSFFLVGHSFGGRISIKAASQSKLPLAGLVLCASAGLPPETSLKLRMLSGIAKGGSSLMKKLKLDWLHYSARDLYYRLLRQHDYLKVPQTMKDTFRLVIEEDLSQYLPQITVPTLLVWGAKDHIVPLDQAYRFHQNIPESRLEIIPNVGHSPQLEEPEKLVNLLSNFFKGLND
jgi:pimeloyl-ACP methyl ester carboxylesterase